MIKRLLTITIAMVLVLSLTACKSSVSDNSSNNDSTGKNSNVAYHDSFIRLMDTIVTEGDEWGDGGMVYQSTYFYRLAGSGISSFRYAVENLLWLLGEGDSIDDLTEGSRYASWDQIAGISLASPFAYYFEGLLAHFQGEDELALELYTNAFLNPMSPEDGLNFYYLRNMKITDLYALRDQLREKEDKIYAKFNGAVRLSECPRDRFNFSGEYLRALAREALEAEDIKTADIYAQAALNADPFSANTYKIAAVCALANDRLYEAGGYIDEGLTLASDDPMLGELRDAIMKQYEEVIAE